MSDVSVIKVRGSRAGLNQACPNSLRAVPGEPTTDSDSEAAAIGRAVHAVAADIVRTNLDGRPDVTQACMDEGISHKTDEVGWLAWEASQWWVKLRSYFTETPEVEVAMEATEYVEGVEATFGWSGHADVLDVARGKNRAYILDWKSGRKTEEKLYVPQMQAYAFLLLESIDWDPAIDEVSVILVWLRDQEITHLVFKAQEIEEWAMAFMQNIITWPADKYAPSAENCNYCPRSTVCPGRRSILNAAVAVFQDPHEIGNRTEGGFPRDQEGLIRAYRLWKALKSFGEDFEKQFKIDVKIAGGTLKGLSGIATLQPVSGKTTVLASKAIPVLLEAGMVETEIREFLNVDKSAMVKAVRAKAPRGEKGNVEQALMEKLSTAKALSIGRGFDKIVLRDHATPSITQGGGTDG